MFILNVFSVFSKNLVEKKNYLFCILPPSYLQWTKQMGIYPILGHMIHNIISDPNGSDPACRVSGIEVKNISNMNQGRPRQQGQSDDSGCWTD